MRFSPEYLGIFGGAHGIDKLQLQRIRTAIALDPDSFSNIINQKEFKDKFDEIKGEKYKRVPPEFSEVFEKEPLIANKEFYYMAELDPVLITKPELPEIIMEYWQAANPVKKFLTNALNS